MKSDAKSIKELQHRICEKYDVDFVQPLPGSKLGLAIETLHRMPIHGVRLSPTENTCGWYIYGGEWSDAPDFYKPLCIDHLEEYCKLALPFLCLPPGWNFITDDKGFIDVWQEQK